MSSNNSTSTVKSNIVDSQTYSGIQFKRLHVIDLSEKYGPGERGIVADEKIHKGELIIRKDPETSIYHSFDDKRYGYTAEAFQQLVSEQKDPEAKAYLLRYSFKPDNQNIFVPQNYLTRNTMDLSALLNHSCEANCTSRYLDEVMAIEDIEPGTVLTVDYGIGITDDGEVFPFEQCRCGTSSCAGTKVFQRYKDEEWQNKFYDYCFPDVKRKIDQLREQKTK